MTYTSESRWHELRDACLDLPRAKKEMLVCLLLIDLGMDDLNVETILRRLDEQDTGARKRYPERS
jgi:hypothetical protein